MPTSDCLFVADIWRKGLIIQKPTALLLDNEHQNMASLVFLTISTFSLEEVLNRDFFVDLVDYVRGIFERSQGKSNLTNILQIIILFHTKQLYFSLCYNVKWNPRFHILVMPFYVFPFLRWPLNLQNFLPNGDPHSQRLALLFYSDSSLVHLENELLIIINLLKIHIEFNLTSGAPLVIEIAQPIFPNSLHLNKLRQFQKTKSRVICLTIFNRNSERAPVLQTTPMDGYLKLKQLRFLCKSPQPKPLQFFSPVLQVQVQMFDIFQIHREGMQLKALHLEDELPHLALAASSLLNVNCPPVVHASHYG